MFSRSEHTNMNVVFESSVLQDEDEMSTELLLCAGVKVEDIFRQTFKPIDFHQLVTNILLTHPQMIVCIYSISSVMARKQ